MYRSSLCFVAIFSAIIAVTSGCTCAPPTFNRIQSYCKAEFTIRGRVVKYEGEVIPPTSDRPHKKYRVYPSRFYRNPTAEMRTIYILTPKGPEFCEKKLVVGRTYIFNGKYYHDEYLINKCEWNQRWYFVPPWYKAALPYLYNFC